MSVCGLFTKNTLENLVMAMFKKIKFKKVKLNSMEIIARYLFKIKTKTEIEKNEIIK